MSGATSVLPAPVRLLAFDAATALLPVSAATALMAIAVVRTPSPASRERVALSGVFMRGTFSGRSAAGGREVANKW